MTIDPATPYRGVHWGAPLGVPPPWLKSKQSSQALFRINISFKWGAPLGVPPAQTIVLFRYSLIDLHSTFRYHDLVMTYT